MIVSCPECNKKFIVKDEMIPPKGRNLQCGKCNNIWFYSLEKTLNEKDTQDINLNKNIDVEKKLKINHVKSNEKILTKTDTKNIESNRSMVISSKNKKIMPNFFKVFLVVIISLIAFIILLDTFKSIIITFYPNIDLILNNLYETLKDINLFIKDLIR